MWRLTAQEFAEFMQLQSNNAGGLCRMYGNLLFANHSDRGATRNAIIAFLHGNPLIKTSAR